MTRERFDPPCGPKPDPLSPDERAEVQRRLAEGEVTRCPLFARVDDITSNRTVAEYREQVKRIGRIQAKGARAKEKRRQAAERHIKEEST